MYTDIYTPITHLYGIKLIRFDKFVEIVSDK